MDLQQTLIEAEREGWTALTTAEGGAYYRAHLAKNALMAFPFGVMDREQAIEAMESAPPWAEFEMRDPRVVALTDASGVVVYSVVARREGEEPYSAVVSSTFVREGGGWRLAFHRQTPT
jgi:Domain of unknown function (DUF4440)